MAEDDEQTLAEDETQVDATVLEDGNAPAADDAGDETPAAESVVPTDPDTLDALWERYPSLREEHERQQADRDREQRNAGAQQREAQLKRESGSRENTHRNVTRFLREAGVEIDDPDRLHFLYDLAQANSVMAVANAIPDELMPSYTVPVEAREESLRLREAGDTVGSLRTLIKGAVDHELAKLRAQDEVENTRKVNERVAAEIKARGLEARPKPNPAPPAPRSGPARTAPTYAEYAEASAAQRSEWRRQGVEPVPA